MSNLLAQAESRLLQPAELTPDGIASVLGQLVSAPGVDAADLYFQHQVSESWVLEDGIVKDGSFNVDQGVGVRAQAGEKTGFAYSNDLHLQALTQAAGAARSIARSGQQGSVQAWQRNSAVPLYLADNPLDSMAQTDKVAFLQRLDAYTRSLDPRVTQVSISLGVIIEHNGRRERGSFGGGGRTDYRFFEAEERGMAYAREAVRQAVVNLDAIAAPAGSMPVVMGPGWSGVLLHEAVGHGLEGDFNRKGSSAYSGRVGQKVASELCTIVDDGTLQGRRGSLSVDDEGSSTNCTVLIENGILKGYIQDKLNARLMGVAPTGNGRRESYAHLPMPRMTNTYMLAGQSDPEEIVRSVKKGIYCANLGGGQVDITSGKFVFSTSEAYLIEDGRITAPVKGATLIGNGPEVMNRVSMVGHDLQLDSGVGTCGKDGQSVPVGVGQPTLKIDQITVGGTGA